MSRDLLSSAPLVKHLAWRLMRVLARDLPAGGAHLLALAGGDLMWFLDAAGRRTLDANLAPLVPDRGARRRAVRGCYQACAGQLAATLRLDRRPLRDPATIPLVDPWGVFAAKPHPGPLVLAGSHVDWDRVMVALETYGLVHDLAVLALPAGDAWVDGELARLRAGAGARTLPWAGPTGAARAALTHLRAGGTLGVLADRDYTTAGAVAGRITVTLGGRRLAVPTGPAELARRSGALLVPVALVAGALVVGRPQRPVAATEVATATRAIAHFHLRALATAPSRWVAFHPVWEVASVQRDCIDQV